MLTCFLCLQKSLNQIKMNSKKAKEMNCSSIISQHFWLKPTTAKNSTECVCLTCWNIVLEFHQLYEFVAKAHNYLESQHELIDALFVPEIKVEITDLELLPKTAVIEDNENRQEIESTLEPTEKVTEVIETSQKLECINTIDNDSDTDMPLSMLLRSKFKIDSDALEISNEAFIKNCALPKKVKATQYKKKKRTDSTSSLDLDVSIVSKYLSEDSSNSSATESGKKKDSDYEPYESGEEEKRKQRRKRKEGIEEKRLKWNETIAKYYKKLECSKCKELFSDFHALTQHAIKTHESKPAVECCKRIFQTRKTLSSHALIHLNLQDVVCSKCDMAFDNKPLLEKHIETHHHCSKCAKDYPNKSSLRAHQILMHTPKSEYKYECTECPERYPLKRKLWEHLNVVHCKGSPIMCDKCGKHVRNAHTLKKHMRLHSDLAEHKTDPVQCDLCGKWLKHADSLRGHKYLLHEQRYQKTCPICSKNMPSESALEKHFIHSHQTERNFKCAICPRAFKVNRDLQQHINTHTKAIVYKCDICGKSFYQTSSLHKHKSVYHRNNQLEEPDPVQCQFCSNWFKTSVGLKQHIRVLHEVSDQEHRCHICNHLSSNSTALKRHIKRNHGNKFEKKVFNDIQPVKINLPARI